MVLSDHKLKLNAEPIPSNQIKNEINAAASPLDKILSSERYATTGSKRDIEELNAATDKRMKNKGPIN